MTTTSSSSSSAHMEQQYASVLFPANTSAGSTPSSAGSCTWYACEECTRPRSCFDCLNAATTDGIQCAINPIGQCVSIADYDSTRDFRLHNNSAGVLDNFYPSTNTTYCSQSDDAQCARCRSLPVSTSSTTMLSGYQNDSALVPFCYGVNGCVCVAACETSNWRNSVIAKTASFCPAKSSPISPTVPPGTNTQSAAQGTTNRPAMILMVISIAGLVVLLGLVWRWWIGHNMDEHRKQRRAHFANMRLTLEGWNAYRQQLIDLENAQLSEMPKPHPLVSCGGGGGQIQDREATADALDAAHDRDGGEPARLVVERGDGYRPASPSENERQRRRRLLAITTNPTSTTTPTTSGFSTEQSTNVQCEMTSNSHSNS